MDKIARFLKKYFNMELDFERTEVRVEGGRFSEERYFEIGLSGETILAGIYFAGRGEQYKPWFEVRIIGRPYPDLFRRLYYLLPEGGHVSIFYSLDEETGKEVKKAVPPATTEKGFILFQAGARWFKNWYFAEGFMEGETKIQGEKTSGKKQLKELKEEMKRFIKKGGPKESLERAKEIMKSL